MKRHPALVNLSRDHYHGLLLAQQMKADAAPYKGYPTDLEGKIRFLFSEYEQKLNPHFKEEETLLFPQVREKSPELAALVDDLIAEHRKLFALIESVQAAGDQKKVLNEFGILLEQHIRKEERRLFELIQETFSDAELAAFENKLHR